jgi:REP element-mobilizing transposase RayT
LLIYQQRPARIDIPGLLQHVIVRGIERNNIFLDDEDREDFVERLTLLLTETRTVCYAWALLDNHFHLLLSPTETTLATLMRRLLTGYAVSFNRRHHRAGHLFQNRYKSIVCDGEAYLLELVRYIHLNPVRSGVVRDLDVLADYRWCGHRQMLGYTGTRLLTEDDVFCIVCTAEKYGKGAVPAVSGRRTATGVSPFFPGRASSQPGERAFTCRPGSL